MFESMIAKLKSNKKKLILTEGSDPRIIEAASRLHKEGILAPVLLGNPDEIAAAAKACS
jgi:phosphate acetyltransferase